MSYIDTSPPSFSSNSLKTAYAGNFSSGVSFCDDDRFSADATSPMSVNLRSKNGRICNFGSQTKLESEIFVSGTFHSMTKYAFCSKNIIHAGTKLYSVDATNAQISEIYSSMPDKPSFAVNFLSKVYFYCGCRVFSADKDFAVKEELAYAPLMYKDCLAGIKSGIKIEGAKLNMLSPRISASYRFNELRSCIFPLSCDTSRKIEVFNKGVPVDENNYSVTESYVLLDNSVTVENDNDIVVSFYLKNPRELGYDNCFDSMTLGTSYGGNVVSGTRIFVTGSPEYPGRYYISSLLDPLRFDEDNFEIIGTGSDMITGFERQYGYLMIFTERSVLRMSYTMNGSDAVFSVKELNSSLGCDCPGSIELIDNRIVFLNSKSGVYIIDTTENFDEQNIKPISRNIAYGNGCGLLELSAGQLKKASSCDFDRKYYLCAGGKMYVWDYGEKAYSDNGGYGEAQKRLVWYYADKVFADCLFECAGKLCAYNSDSSKGISVFSENGESFGQKICVRFCSGNIDFSYPADAKNVESVIFGLEESKEQVEFTAFADGEKYYSGHLIKLPGTLSRYGIKLPYSRLYTFGFEIKTKGKFTLKNITVNYRLA